MKTKQNKVTYEETLDLYERVKEYCGYPELDVNKVRRLADASHLSFRNMCLVRLDSTYAFLAYCGDELIRLECGLDWLIEAEKKERK